jgi:hypothetical protein
MSDTALLEKPISARGSIPAPLAASPGTAESPRLYRAGAGFYPATPRCACGVQLRCMGDGMLWCPACNVVIHAEGEL